MSKSKSNKRVAYIKKTMKQNETEEKNSTEEIATNTVKKNATNTNNQNEKTTPITKKMVSHLPEPIDEQIENSLFMSLFEKTDRTENSRNKVKNLLNQMKKEEKIIINYALQDKTSSDETKMRFIKQLMNNNIGYEIVKIYFLNPQSSVKEAERKAREEAELARKRLKQQQAKEAERKAREEAELARKRLKQQQAKEAELAIARRKAREEAELERRKAREEAEKARQISETFKQEMHTIADKLNNNTEDTVNTNINILVFLNSLKEYTKDKKIIDGINLAIKNCDPSIVIPKGISSIENLKSRSGLTMFEYLPSNIVASSLLSLICKGVKESYKKTMDWIDKGISSNLVK